MRYGRLHTPTASASLSSIHVFVLGDGSTVTVQVAGDVTQETASRVYDVVDSVATRPTVRVIELHLQAVTLLDAAGIRCLLRCRRLLADTGRVLLVIRPSRQVVTALTVTDLLATFGAPPVCRPASVSPGGGCLCGP